MSKVPYSKSGSRSLRKGTTTLLYNAADLVVTNTAPAPAAGQSAPVTVIFYDTSLRQTGQRLPDGAVVTNAFLADGLRQKTWGSRLYPVECTFDYAGRMKTMTTWQPVNQSGGSGVNGSGVTTWNYDTVRGWLTSKTHADGLERWNGSPVHFRASSPTRMKEPLR